MVPHLVVPPVHWKMQVPWLQMVMAEGSVGQTVPHEPLQTAQRCSVLPSVDACPPAVRLPPPPTAVESLTASPQQPCLERMPRAHPHNETVLPSNGQHGLGYILIKHLRLQAPVM